MNKKFDISDGVLEMYALGMLRGKQQAEVEEWLKTDEVARVELEKCQQALAGMTEGEKMTPPDSFRAGVMDAIKDQEGLAGGQSKDASSRSLHTAGGANKRPAGIISFYKWASIAAVLVIVTGTIYWFQMRDQLLQRSEQLTVAYEQIDSLKTENKALIKQVGTLNNRQDKLIYSVKMMSDTNVFKVELNTVNAESGTGKVMVFWDRSSGGVYCKPLVLPAIDDQHDFQLWSIENGQPVDMGVMHSRNTEEIVAPIKMKNTKQEPSAFAVTIEPKGGQAQPTLDKMVVMGEL